MPEIYCNKGKVLVNLPQEAWGLENSAIIPTCNGCKLPSHINIMARLERSAIELAKLGPEIIKTHRVSVVPNFMYGEGEDEVMCFCDCKLNFPSNNNP